MAEIKLTKRLYDENHSSLIVERLNDSVMGPTSGAEAYNTGILPNWLVDMIIQDHDSVGVLEKNIQTFIADAQIEANDWHTIARELAPLAVVNWTRNWYCRFCKMITDQTGNNEALHEPSCVILRMRSMEELAREGAV